MFKEYDVQLRSRVYKTPYLTFTQDGVLMTAQVCEHSFQHHRTGRVHLAWVSFAEEGGWSEPELVIWASDDKTVQVGPHFLDRQAKSYTYYRVYPEEVHPSILEVIEERESA